MKTQINKFTIFLKRSRVILGLFIAIAAVLLTTLVSIFLYNRSGVSRLDLSRPGYAEVIKEVGDDKANEPAFSNTGPIDSKVLADFLKLYEEQQKPLNTAGDFGDESISDQRLNLPTLTE